MANWTLELTFPKAPGAAGTGLDSGHKVYNAHPGVPYRAFAAAVGGTPQYVWSISGQPSGMTINTDTGEIAWSNPTTGTHTGITITVTDQDNNTSAATYDLVVATTSFRFIAATGGSDVADGSINTPWATIDKLYDDLNDVFVYFRTGTYTLAGVPVTSGADPEQDTCIFAQSAGRCTTWMAYPGETATINFESDHTTPGGRKPSIRLNGNRTYVDGLRFLDGYNKCLWLDRGSGRGTVVINNQFINLGTQTDGSFASTNAACVMFTHQTQTYNDVIVNNYSENIGYNDDEISLFKFYDNIKLYFAFNTGDTSLNSVECVAFKDSCKQFMDYRNEIVTANQAWGGNHHQTAPYDGTSGEVWFSRYKATVFAVRFNQDSQAHEMYWERCTFEGPLNGRNVDELDGPFIFRNCVIVNEDGAQTPWQFIQDTFSAQVSTDSGGSGVQDSSRVTILGDLTPVGTENLMGNAAAAIVDASGLLQGSYRTSFVGFKGHEIVAAASSSGRTRHRGFRLRAA